VRKLTRAHVALATRAAVVDAALAARDAVANTLGVQLGAPVAIGARLSDATLHPLTTLSAHAMFASLELNGDALALLELDQSCVAELLRRAAGSAATGTALTLTRIEEAALGGLLLSAVGAARSVQQAQQRFSPRLVGLYATRRDALVAVDGRRRHVAIALDLHLGEHRSTGRLLLPATWLELLANAEPAEPVGPLHPTLAGATLSATCLLGLMSVPRHAATSFCVGDVLLFPGVGFGARLTGPARLVTRSFSLHGAFGADGFTFTHSHPLEHPMTSAFEDPTLPVDVEIELTRLRLPLHQLGALKPGAVLPLHVGAAQTVVVRVGDRAVARAELVEVDGEVGARILAML
jgi:type III secretion protein Q